MLRKLATAAVVALLMSWWALVGPVRGQTPPAPASGSVSMPIALGIEHVRGEVQGVRRAGGLRVPWQQLAAQSALTYVQSRLSPAIYAASGGSDDLTTAFARQAALCGQIVEAFLQIMQGVGARVLPVQFFYVAGGVRQSHVAAQVRWGGRWRYVDPTWGALFERDGEVLSPQQVLRLADPQRYAVMNRLVPWTDANLRRGGGWSPLSYLTVARERQVILDGAGTIVPPRRLEDGAARWDLTLLPDYVGTYPPYARQLVGVRMRLALPADARALVLSVRGKLCGGLGVLHVGGDTVPFADVPDLGELHVARLPGTSVVTLWADGGDPAEPCAVLLTGVRTA